MANIMGLMDIVQVNIPVLLRLDFLDSESLSAHDVTNRLAHRDTLSRSIDHVQYEDVRSVPISRHSVHLHLQI